METPPQPNLVDTCWWQDPRPLLLIWAVMILVAVVVLALADVALPIILGLLTLLPRAHHSNVCRPPCHAHLGNCRGGK
jgi:hypothetical protein